MEAVQRTRKVLAAVCIFGDGLKITTIRKDTECFATTAIGLWRLEGLVHMSYKGECSCCGKCCEKVEMSQDGFLVLFRCENLLTFDKTGKPSATACAAYAHRTNGMPIVMRSLDGRFAYRSKCLASYPRPEDAVPPECSYKFVPDELVQVEPQWDIRYVPAI